MSAGVVHSARLLDGTGGPAVEHAWLAWSADGVVTAVGVGDGWRSRAGDDGGDRDDADDDAGGAVVDAGGGWLLPGFVDLHRHGGGLHAHEEGPAAVLAAAAAHLAHGTTRGVVSLVAADVEALAERLGWVADLVDARTDGVPTHPELLGSHLEGPFLAAERCGAHDPAVLTDPTPAVVQHLVAAARGTLRQVTLDPRRPGAREAARAFRRAGAVVAVGHTEATDEEARAAFDDGARLLTHAFNAMPGIHHRAPGPVVAALDDERVVLELVLDGEHVHPRVAALLLAAAPGRVALVTDAMAAAAVPAPRGDATGPGESPRMRIGSLDVEVTAGSTAGGPGRVVLAGTDVLAGSTLTLDAALRVGVAAGLALAALVQAATSTPARVLRLGGGVGTLAPGGPADLVLLDDTLRVAAVRLAGRPVPLAGAPA